MIEKNHPYIDELGFVPNNKLFKIYSHVNTIIDFIINKETI